MQKNSSTFIIIVSHNSEDWIDSSRWFSFRVSHAIAVRMSGFGSEGSFGTLTSGSRARKTHGTGGWKSGLLRRLAVSVCLSIRAACTVAGSLTWQLRHYLMIEMETVGMVSSDLAWETMPCHLYSIAGTKSEPLRPVHIQIEGLDSAPWWNECCHL